MNSMSDADIVQHVLRNKANFYRVLMVETTATAEQIKSSYKKMALRCHPDKNKEPKSEDAFKLVGMANTTLSDATKRRIYDRHGTDGVQRHESNTAQREANARRPAQPRRQADFFEEFFFGPQGGFARQPQQQQRRGGGADGAAAVGVDANLMMMVPILIFLLLAVLLQSGFTDVESGPFGPGGRPTNAAGDSFSLTPNPKEGLTIERMTSLHNLRVKFYTSRRWSDLMDRRRDVLYRTEQEVLISQRNYLGNRCEAETFKHRARGRGDLPSVCSEFHHFRKVVGRG